MRVVLVLLVAAIVLAGGVLAWFARAPSSLRATYDREVTIQLTRASAARSTVTSNVLTESELQRLPRAVQRYIRLSGAVGQPHVQNVRARMRGRIRSGPDARWMSFTGEQHNFFDQPSRLFYLDARMVGLPVQVFHRYVGSAATMRVTLAWTMSMVNAAGPQMDVGETVTMFNDMCWLAAGSLISNHIAWEEIDASTVRATFTNAGHTVKALLRFNDQGELIDFESDDRTAASSDGQSFTAMRWSTPLGPYRTFGRNRVSGGGEGRWHPASGSYTYIELELLDVAYNVPVRDQ